jgi:hypothetical protein
MNTFAFIKNQRPAANVLFVVAVAQLFLGTLYGWFYWNNLEYTYWQGWVFIFSSPVYLALGLLVRWLKHYSLLIGFVLYLYLTFTVHAEPYAELGVWQNGLILKLPVLTFLLWGLLMQNNWEQPGEKWKALLTAIFMIIFGFGMQYAIHEIINLNYWIGSVQDSLKGIARGLPKETRITGLLDIFCKANLNALRRSAIAGCIFGFSSFGLLFLLIKTVIRATGHKN